MFQRVSESKVEVDQRVVGKIGAGLMVLLGVETEDAESDAKYLADKTAGLRIFDDSDGKMNLDVTQINGEVLVVSQFTLLGDVRKGRRPSFVRAAEPETGNFLYERYVQRLRELGLNVETGQFRSQMNVSLINNGPVTILLDSKKRF